MSQEKIKNNYNNNYDNKIDLEETSSNENNQENLDKKEGKSKKKKSFKTKVILIETIILIVVLAVGYLYYNNQAEKRNEINSSYENLQILESEINNCDILVNKEEEGNLDEYDYCRILLKKFK